MCIVNNNPSLRSVRDKESASVILIITSLESTWTENPKVLRSMPYTSRTLVTVINNVRQNVRAVQYYEYFIVKNFPGSGFENRIIIRPFD